jgi:hypothetical protein
MRSVVETDQQRAEVATLAGRAVKPPVTNSASLRHFTFSRLGERRPGS